MKKGLIINENLWPMVDDLEPDEKAELLTALSAYYQGNELPYISRITAFIFKRICADNARFDPENRKALSEIRAEAGRIGGSKPKQNKQTEANGSKPSNSAQDKDKEKDKEKEGEKEGDIRFTPPTAEQVRAYAHGHGLKINADRFVDFYSSKGWMVGKAKMKDWQAAVRNWAARDRQEAPETKKTDYRSMMIAHAYGEAST